MTNPIEELLGLHSWPRFENWDEPTTTAQQQLYRYPPLNNIHPATGEDLNKRQPMMTKPAYGQDITYTNIYGSKTTCSVSGCDTSEEATRKAVELAEMDGWTNPKWWQWWRWGDTKLND